MSHIRPWALYLLVLLAWGCASPTRAVPVSSPAPFLTATSEDATQLAILTADLDTVALECAAAAMCPDDVHFSRALVSLFENREAARASFEQVVSLHPSSPLVGPSTLWLQLLGDEAIPSASSDAQRRIITELSTFLAREWIGRRLDLSGRTGRKSAQRRAVPTQAFYKQLQERDRHIAELRFQLDALRVIDRDQQDRRKVKTPKIDAH